MPGAGLRERRARDCRAPHPLDGAAPVPRRRRQCRGQDRQHNPSETRPTPDPRHRDRSAAGRLVALGTDIQNRRNRPQFGSHDGGRSIALVEALCECFRNHRIELRRQSAIDRRRRRGPCLHNRARLRRRRGAGERQLSRQHLEQHDAQREDVGAMVDTLAAGLLRREICSGPRRDTGRRVMQWRCRGGGLPGGGARRPCGQTEIEDFGLLFRRDDDVLARDIAVDETVGVSLGEGVGDLRSEIDGAAGMERPSADDVLQRAARNELAGQEQPVLILAGLVERGNVRMGQGRRGTRVMEKPLAAIRIVGDAGREHFDRHGTTDAGVASAVHLAQAADADLVEDPVVPERFEHRSNVGSAPHRGTPAHTTPGRSRVWVLSARFARAEVRRPYAPLPPPLTLRRGALCANG
jgi:hypothetical protein